ncbi:Sulfhydryl oxidase 1 [Linum perenne]
MSPTSLILSLSSLLFLLLLTPASSNSGSRSLLRSISGDNPPEADIAVDLNATSFDAVLRDTPATHAIVEFFANWCPACRNYKPQYEKVARLFNGPDAVHPGILLMARVDCASKINSDLCDKFSISHYPMLFWGTPSKFLSGGWQPTQEKTEIRAIESDDAQTADKLIAWINKQLGSSYGLDDQKFENEHLPSNISDVQLIARAVYDVEEATSTAFEIIFSHKMIKAETRASLIKFLQILVAHHPSKRCRKGSAEVLVNFDDLSPPDTLLANGQEAADNSKAAFGSFRICGKDIPRGYWMFCRGSRNETRGFSCGLWVLLHSLSVRVDDKESQFTFTTICDFVSNFFICEECRQHFHEMCSSVKTPFETSRDVTLWLWSAHNKVNERLMKEEATLETGDPKFPKMIWPPKQLCPACHRSTSRARDGSNQVDWDMDEVYRFLVNYYGKTLVSLYNKKDVGIEVPSLPEDTAGSTNAVVVPVGAALAIALASCAFGALACYWRSRQKSRKYYHQLYSLKNI